MELIKLDSNLPLKAYPNDELKEIILSDFIVWVSDLLSLTDKVSANRLFHAIPALEVQCWSMGFAEIKKMFEMYADNKLSIKPIPNYFDRILFGKIAESYKAQKQKKKLMENYISQDEKDFIMTEAVDRIQKDYNQNGKITETCHHVYDFLFEQGKLPEDKSYKVEQFKKAVEIHEQEPIQDDMLKEITDRFEKQEINEVKNIAKRLCLEDYFKNL